MIQLPLYVFSPASDNSICLQTSLKYFEDRFVCEPMRDNWCPPVLSVSNTSKKPKDFVGFDLRAPVVSAKGMERLQSIIGQLVEFLPLIDIKNTMYYAINVLALSDCLDYEKSDILYSRDDPDRILMISEFHFIAERIPDWPIFKVLPSSEVFVRRSFVDCVIENGLTNAVFSDPAIDAIGPLSRGEDINVVPEAPR